MKKRATTIKPYLTQIRKYMKFCYGIRINDDDFRDYILDYIEPEDDVEEPEPITKEELGILIDHATNQKRKTMYMVAKDTGGRLKELLQLTKENFDFKTKFVKVTFPKIPNETKKEKPKEITKKEEKITIKKSTYNNMLKGVIVTITIAAFFGGVLVGTFDKSDSGLTIDEFNEILSATESRAAPAPQPAQQTAQPNTPQIFKVSLDDDPVKGNPNAPVTVVEFSDFQCPFCLRFFQQTLPLIEENYIDTGKIKFVYKDLPLDSIHPNARATHIAAECADEQGKFWEYHDVLFESQAEWQSLASSNLQSTLSQYATDLGLQAASFESCMQSQDISDEVNMDTLEAFRYGATGTPTFFIGNENDGFIRLVGAQPYAVFQSVIDAQLG